MSGGPPYAELWRGRDLDDRSEITEMVRRFYADVAQDDILGPMFNEVAKVDWSVHLPKLADFWCRALLAQPGYEGNPYREHQRVHAKRPFEHRHFERWLELFEETVTAGWSGRRADRALAFARRVAEVHERAIVGSGTDSVPAGLRSPAQAL